MQFFTKKTPKSVAIEPLNKKTLKVWLSKQDVFTKDWVNASEFKAKAEEVLIVPNSKGGIKTVLFGINEDKDIYKYAALPAKLPNHPAGYYLNDNFSKEESTRYAIGWALGCYKFIDYKSDDEKEFAKLIIPDSSDKKLIKSTIDATFLVRDLINIPSNDMGPEELALASKKLAKAHKATIKITTGNDLLKQNYPAIYEVGKASTRKPCLIDLKWGNAKHPKVTLVGKGVCYDTGGLNLKTGSSMSLMKKDMGGAAHVLGLASMIMEQKLPVRLRVLIPAVENSVAGNSYRPGDIIKTRKGISVEIGNTDAEGRIVLADALTEAAKENPKLVIDFATLTGAARAALGPDLPPIFSNDDRLAEDLITSSKNSQDPLWHMPLWQPYKKMLDSKVAEINNIGTGGFAGAITAALFLEKFIEKETPWVHIDTFGWTPSSKPGRPVGGEALGMRAVYDLIANKFTKK